jgi:hypothetical protein
VVEHPCVTDVIKTATDVALKNPPCAVLFGQRAEALLDGVSGRAFRSKTLGVEIGSSLRDREQRQQIECLHGAVLHRGDSQRSQLPIGLREIDTAAVAADSRAVAVCRWPCIWTPECSRLLRPLPACSCPDCASLVSQPTLDRKTSGSAAIARLSPCRDGLPVLP